MSDVQVLSEAQVAELAEALERAEFQAMNTLRRTDPGAQLIIEDEESEPGTVHEAVAAIVSDLHGVYKAVAALGIRPIHPGWEG